MSFEQNPKLAERSAIRARQRAIGIEIKRAFEHVLSEPVPAEFTDILRGMDRAPNRGQIDATAQP